MDISNIVLVLLVSFSLLAFFDGIVLHLWKYQLYRYSDTFYEHILHSLRATLFPILLLGLFFYDLRGPLFLGVIFLTFVDLVIQGFDMWEENKARKRFGGLSSLEYILHVVLTSFHTSMILLYIISKPEQAWNFADSTFFAASPNEYLVALNLLPGAVIVALLHWILALPSFRKTEISFSTKEEKM